MRDQKSLRIIEAAVAEFAEHGFFKTKTDGIAEKAQVSKGLVFHYYQSKKNLYGEAVAFAIDRLSAELNQQLFPRDSLLALFDYSMKLKFRMAETYPQEMQLLLDAYGNLESLPDELYEKVMSYIEVTRTQHFKLVSEILREMPIKASVNKEDVVHLVIMTFNQIELEARSLMGQEKVNDLHFFDVILKRSEVYMSILENGFIET